MTQALTTITPVMIDSTERLENVLAVTKFIKEHIQPEDMIVVEFGQRLKLGGLLDPGIRYIAVESREDDVWNKSKLINLALPFVATEVVSVWDSDVILPATSITTGVKIILDGDTDFATPHNMFYHIKRKLLRFVQTNSVNFGRIIEDDTLVMEKFQTAGGGCILMRTKTLRHFRGMNELFWGWGYEDDEVVFRFKTLGYTPLAVIGPLLHISHPRTATCWPDDKFREGSEIERQRVLSYSKEQLETYFGVTPKLSLYTESDLPDMSEEWLQEARINQETQPVVIPEVE